MTYTFSLIFTQDRRRSAQRSSKLDVLHSTCSIFDEKKKEKFNEYALKIKKTVQTIFIWAVIR